jgi:hypothetical protein
MSKYHLKRIAIATLIVVGILGLMPKLLAQNGDPHQPQRAADRVPTLTGKGTMTPAKTQAGGTPPPALPAAEKQKLLNGKQANLYARLTVNQSYIHNKAGLSFFGASQVNAGEDEYENIAVWPGKANPKLNQVLLISLKPATTGQVYVFDIAVRAEKKGDEFTVQGADGHKEVFTATGDSQHLLIFVKADDPVQDQITVASSNVWTFYSCEIAAM